MAKAASSEDDLEALYKAFGESYRKERARQKSEDIIEFIGENWKIFCKSGRNVMKQCIQDLGKDGDYSVDALCDALGLPSNVYFKRSPVADIGGAILDFSKSSLLKLFLECVEKTPSREVCLFVVAGKKSICITNMQTNFEHAELDVRFIHPEHEIHIFKAADAAHRLHNFFNNNNPL